MPCGKAMGILVAHVHLLRMDSLEHFLQEETGVQEDAVLAYLSDGRRLQKENIRDLAGMEDQVRGVSLTP